MEKFCVGENVVVRFDDGGSASGKVIKVLPDNRYLIFHFCSGGMTSANVHASQLTSFGTALFLVTESYEASIAELEEVVD